MADDMDVDAQIDVAASNPRPATAGPSSAVVVELKSSISPSTSTDNTAAKSGAAGPSTSPAAKSTAGAPMDGVLANVGVPCTGATVLAPNTIVPSVTVSLHPLVILHLSEHWTRIRAQEGQKQQVIGALIGKQKGRNIEVMNAFELRFDTIDGDIIINQEYYATKEQQCKLY